MALDGGDIYASLEEEQAAHSDLMSKIDDRLMPTPEVIAFKDGEIKAENRSIITPYETLQKVEAGAIEMVQLPISGLYARLEDDHGPSRQTDHTNTFGQSASNPDLTGPNDKFDIAFNNDMKPGPV